MPWQTTKCDSGPTTSSSVHAARRIVAQAFVCGDSDLGQLPGGDLEEVRKRTAPYMKGGRLDVRGVIRGVIWHRILLPK